MLVEGYGPVSESWPDTRPGNPFAMSVPLNQTGTSLLVRRTGHCVAELLTMQMFAPAFETKRAR